MFSSIALSYCSKILRIYRSFRSCILVPKGTGSWHPLINMHSVAGFRIPSGIDRIRIQPNRQRIEPPLLLLWMFSICDDFLTGAETGSGSMWLFGQLVVCHNFVKGRAMLLSEHLFRTRLGRSSCRPSSRRRSCRPSSRTWRPGLPLLAESSLQVNAARAGCSFA